VKDLQRMNGLLRGRNPCRRTKAGAARLETGVTFPGGGFDKTGRGADEASRFSAGERSAGSQTP
jgi:hypothetical protein